VRLLVRVVEEQREIAPLLDARFLARRELRAALRGRALGSRQAGQADRSSADARLVLERRQNAESCRLRSERARRFDETVLRNPRDRGFSARRQVREDGLECEGAREVALARNARCAAALVAPGLVGMIRAQPSGLV
jgi:hypothetical protein